jgi:hypothetical protein
MYLFNLTSSFSGFFTVVILVPEDFCLGVLWSFVLWVNPPLFLESPFFARSGPIPLDPDSNLDPPSAGAFLPEPADADFLGGMAFLPVDAALFLYGPGLFTCRFL